MANQPVQTVQLNCLIDRIRAGDNAARDELLHAVCGRLEKLARKMLQRFPSVKRWAETDDVLQNALMRLFRALEQVKPNSVRDFFGLAAEQMRRELLDLARHFGGSQGIGANHASGALKADAEGSPRAEPAAPMSPAEEMDRWQAFHHGVEQLPAEERETVGLIYYHGWTQQAVADLFQVSTRTVQRRWESAIVKLRGLS